MAVTYFFYANDYEYDAESEFATMRPARNNRDLFSILRDQGARRHLICLDGFHLQRPTRPGGLADIVPTFWGTNDFPTLFARFDELTDAPPFAIYVWDLVTHIEHSLALSAVASGLTDQIERACAAADDAIGVFRSTLERKGLLQNTAIVVYGDHGDDYWTHGFKGGMIHGTEPHTDIIHTPLAIRDGFRRGGEARRSPREYRSSIAPTCLELLGVAGKISRSVIRAAACFRGEREFAFAAQNFTASQAGQPGNRCAEGISR